MNIYDISQRAGVSIATVSRVINNSSHVSEATRKKVMKVIESSGYVPNAFARGLGLGSMKTVGLLCPDASDPYHAMAISMLEKSFRECGYDCLLQCTDDTTESRRNGVESLRTRRVDGMVLIGSVFVEANEHDNRYIIETAQTMPVVIMGAELDGENVYSVLCDDEQATCMAVHALLEGGAKDILYLYHAATFSGRRKLAGFYRGLKECGRELTGAMVKSVPPEVEGDLSRIRDLLLNLDRGGMKFDAVLTSEDPLAVGALKYARAAGRTIPDDLKVMGYNNSSICQMTEPELSSVDSHLSAVTQNVVSTMMDVLSGKAARQRQMLGADLVHRATTKAY